MANQRSKLYDISIILLVIGLVLAKINTLSLPYFWDEAWVYATGIHSMYRNGLSLFPGSIPFEISRGHPLFFHFTSAMWMRIFGNTIFISHIFPLLISCSLVYLTYFFGKAFFSPAIGFFSALTLAIQPVFLAQSSMLLPEIMLATLALVTLYFFLTERKLFFLFTATALLMTKESGIVLLFAILLKESIDYLFGKSRSILTKEYFHKLLLILIPIFLSSIFFILQKIKTGYYLFPLHISGDNYILEAIYSKLISFSSFLFIYQGRNSLSLILILSIVFYFVKGKKIVLIRRETEIIFQLILFIALFLIFSASNFYSPRYLLTILPIFILVTYYIFITVFNKTKWVISTGLVLVISVGIYFCIHKKSVDDHNLSYSDAVKVSQDAVKYCEQKGLFQSRILSNFLMRTYLTNPVCGYLAPGNVFNNVTNEFTNDTEYIIVLNYENSNDLESVSKKNNFELLKRFERSIAWCEIYKRK